MDSHLTVWDCSQLQSKRIVIFGAGYWGKIIAQLIEDTDGFFTAHAVIDNNQNSPNQIRSLDVYSMNDFRRLYHQTRDDIIIVISIFNEEARQQVRAQCESLGFSCTSYTNVRAALLEKNRRIPQAAPIWDDQWSHDVYAQKIRYLKTENTAFLPPETPDQYFCGVVPWERYRSFVDAGALHGDTLKTYKQKLRGGFDNYYAFEPSCDLFKNLVVEAADDPHIHLYNTAVWNNNGTISFSGTSCVFGGKGDLEVPAVTLDLALRDRPVTMIKMDIEGAEPNALEGARSIIETQRPALAISVYHHTNDLWEIPLWIKQIQPDYRLYLRHHSSDWYDTVCYAI